MIMNIRLSSIFSSEQLNAIFLPTVNIIKLELHSSYAKRQVLRICGLNTYGRTPDEKTYFEEQEILSHQTCILQSYIHGHIELISE